MSIIQPIADFVSLCVILSILFGVPAFFVFMMYKLWQDAFKD